MALQQLQVLYPPGLPYRKDGDGRLLPMVEIDDVTGTIYIGGQAVSGGGGGISFSLAVSEVPVGAVDGVNTVFTLAHTPLSGFLLLAVNGVIMAVPDDYGLAVATITFVAAPASGSSLRAWYLY